MITILRQCVSCNIWVATLKARVTTWPCSNIVSGQKLCYLKSDFTTSFDKLLLCVQYLFGEHYPVPTGSCFLQHHIITITDTNSPTASITGDFYEDLFKRYGVVTGWGLQADGRPPPRLKQLQIPIQTNVTLCHQSTIVPFDPSGMFCAGYTDPGLYERLHIFVTILYMSLHYYEFSLLMATSNCEVLPTPNN